MFASFFLRLLNREASSPKNKPSEVIQSLQIREGLNVADIGSGGGFFTLEFARRAGKTGRVYAVDARPEYLEFVKGQAEKEGLQNVAFVSARGADLSLPENSLDLAFLRNVFHHLPEPRNYFRDLKRFLKPKGKVAIIEHKKKAGFSFVALLKHYTPNEFIVMEMEEAGYSLVESFDFLSEQTFNVFELK
jgi:ubiquinone/menaquinone biosynthesis C-methylase UbiE